MTEGYKDDSSKARWDLMPMELLNEVAGVLGFGAKKYGENNWQSLEDGRNRYFAALMRHIIKYRMGERIDPETSYSHLAHAVCNLLFMDWFDSEVAIRKQIEEVCQKHVLSLEEAAQYGSFETGDETGSAV